MGKILDGEVALLKQFAADHNLTYTDVDSQATSGKAMLVGTLTGTAHLIFCPGRRIRALEGSDS